MFEDLFRKRLYQLRIDKGVSARDMSLSLGQNPGYINSIENRINLPTMANFFFICDFFGVTPSEFFNEKDKYPMEVQEIINILLSLDKESLDAVRTMIKLIEK